MKKFVLLLLSSLILATSYGQDTITENDTCYMYWPYIGYFLVGIQQPGTPPFIFPQHVFFWENTAVPGTSVYGVSLRGEFPLDSIINVSLAWKVRGQYNYFDTVILDESVVFRYFKYTARPHEGDDTAEFGERCSEIYFHRPWQVPDTFYVVVRHEGNPDGKWLRNVLKTNASENPIYPQRYGWAYVNDEPTIFEPYTQWDTCPVPCFSSAWGHEFPILEPNRRRCRKPTGLHIAERGDTWVVLAWDSGSGDSYRVTVESPDSTFVRETSDTSILLQELLPDSIYQVDVQSLCRYQYYSYDSTYVNPGRARLGFWHINNGMDGLGAGQLIEIRPNPANHKVEVVSSLSINSIEVVDVTGRVVDSHVPVTQNSFTIDVSSLTPGIYHLRILTPSGLTMKKLLVQ